MDEADFARANARAARADRTDARAVSARYLPAPGRLVVVLSNGADFQAQYPHFEGAQRDWGLFVAYELLFLFYWLGWEYLWRGFVLFGTAPAFGLGAIFVQMVPFALLHAEGASGRRGDLW